MERIVPNLSPPICVTASERGRLCVISSVETGHIDTLAHSSFRWKGPERGSDIQCPPTNNQKLQQL